MIRGTTPNFTLTITDKQGHPVDFSEAEHIYVAIRQGNNLITLSDDELTIDENVISCYLNQENSLALVENNKAKIQVNWTYIDGLDPETKRSATVVKEIMINEQLIKEVLP